MWRNPWVWGDESSEFYVGLVAGFYLSFCVKLSEWGELQICSRMKCRMLAWENVQSKLCMLAVFRCSFFFLTIFFLFKSCSHVSLWSIVDIAQSCGNLAFLRFLCALSCWIFVCGCCLALIMNRCKYLMKAFRLHFFFPLACLAWSLSMRIKQSYLDIEFGHLGNVVCTSLEHTLCIWFWNSNL